MADPATEFALAKQQIQDGPPHFADWHTKYLFYDNARRWVVDFIVLLNNRFLHADKSLRSEEQNQGRGLRVLQQDHHLYEQAVDLEQSLSDQLSYLRNFDYAVDNDILDPHAYALEKMHDPRNITSRKLYGLPPAPTTDARMPRYGYGFK